MSLSKLFLFTGATLIGAYFLKTSAARAAPEPAAGGAAGSAADLDLDLDEDVDAYAYGSGDGDLAAVDKLQQNRPAAPEAGMPADMSNDSDNVRPGFADYARGA